MLTIYCNGCWWCLAKEDFQTHHALFLLESSTGAKLESYWLLLDSHSILNCPSSSSTNTAKNQIEFLEAKQFSAIYIWWGPTTCKNTFESTWSPTTFQQKGINLPSSQWRKVANDPNGSNNPLFEPTLACQYYSWLGKGKTTGREFSLSLSTPSYQAFLFPHSWDIHSTPTKDPTREGSKYCRWNNNSGALNFDGRPWVWWQDGRVGCCCSPWVVMEEGSWRPCYHCWFPVRNTWLQFCVSHRWGGLGFFTVVHPFLL